MADHSITGSGETGPIPSGLGRRADHDLADIDIGRLFDGESDGAGDRLRRHRNPVARLHQGVSQRGVTDALHEAGAYEPWRDERHAERLASFLTQALGEGARLPW